MLAHDSKQTLHYCDPPYPHSTRGNTSVRYGYNHDFSDADHIDLAVFLKTLEGSVMISGYDCDLYKELYASWLLVKKNAYADGARIRKEMLWISPNTETSRLNLIFNES